MNNPKPADAQIAQLVEQRTENPRVAGSIPALGTFFMIKYSERNQTGFPYWRILFFVYCFPGKPKD